MENLEYIDNYFNHEPVPEQIKEFEERLTADSLFAEEVAFYLSAWQVAKEEVAAEKKRRFAEIYQQDMSHARLKATRKLWPYLAVAAVLSGIIFGWYQIVQPPAAQRYASQYIRDNFENLSINMGGGPDSLQQGLQLFNDGKFAEASQSFEAIIRSDTSNFLAKKYAGIVSLRLKEYNKAFNYFKELGNYKELHSNPGKFYQAVTCLNRNGPGDIQLAKQLLQQVVDSDLEGTETARKWLRQL